MILVSKKVEVLALGAGPANLALGVAMEEMAADELAEHTVIAEAHGSVAWQRGMLLPWTQSQVSFLKDLVTLRNPRSRFSFVNYLHSVGRLDEFINLGTFTPYRQEISNYLSWVAESLSSVRIAYGKRATEVYPRRTRGGRVEGWETRFTDGTTTESRDVVIGIGREALIPDALADLPDDRVFHSGQYTERIAGVDPASVRRIVVVGGAQSAAELVWAAHQGFPSAETTMIMRSIGLKNYESSKFTNEIFYPSFIDEFHEAGPEARRQLLGEMHLSNYGGLAPAMLDTLYRQRYLERLSGQERLRLLTMTDISAARLDGDEVVLSLTNRRTGLAEELRCDLILLGTGFRGTMPTLVRNLARELGLKDITVDRGYRLHVPDRDGASCYLQGVNEATHGIADSLLSVLASRSGDIVGGMLADRRKAPALVDLA
ncbi:SidA/IucD/PvdA family monooxygenase [Streptomyces sp. 8L]|uniref:SidA/IucD/PvdA family monooxygenase n=1 Tax=Streptomyces sp. 8L TaxID=2877242 RepID=UPI0027E16953|nr:SidA/IucD/PvdA family monooxygenase [Streptomyces sp. 8L]